ncbi:MAG: hypothetical protein KKA79_06830 [Nanoarchaeota archaeon]|nr:hypothetical protein [Nanoarchaeota archaeon]MCG2717916.1 hypothetical protein [Nanoarchaeota archaeon]
MKKLNNRLRWALIGAFLGGLIALIGFLVLKLTPDTSFITIILFMIPRAILGAIVAMILGPIAEKKKRSHGY